MWFAFKLVSLNHWKQRRQNANGPSWVVICFQISIFEPLKTTRQSVTIGGLKLWFAFKLVSLNHWKQRHRTLISDAKVVICFQISIFEPLKTTQCSCYVLCAKLWFAFKLVSLNHWKQPRCIPHIFPVGCDLLSN